MSKLLQLALGIFGVVGGLCLLTLLYIPATLIIHSAITGSMVHSFGDRIFAIIASLICGALILLILFVIYISGRFIYKGFSTSEINQRTSNLLPEGEAIKDSSLRTEEKSVVSPKDTLLSKILLFGFICAAIWLPLGQVLGFGIWISVLIAFICFVLYVSVYHSKKLK